MTHDDYREMLLLSSSGTLDADERAVLERHVSSCEECRSEQSRLLRLREVIVRGRGGVEVSDRLLSEARQELRIALRKEQERRSPWTAWLDIRALRPAYQFTLGAACTLAIGILIGRMAFPSAVPPSASSPAPALVTASESPSLPGETRISNVHFFDHGSRTGTVDFSFDAVTPVRMKGSVDDPKIQRVLTYAMLNEENPGVRLRAVNAINAPGTDWQERDVKEALITALANDANAGVRKEALNALRRLPWDDDIKKALLHTLVSDANPGLRVAAINALDSARSPARGLDADVLAVLREKARSDDNNYIRVKARTVLLEARHQ